MKQANIYDFVEEPAKSAKFTNPFKTKHMNKTKDYAIDEMNKKGIVFDEEYTTLPCSD